MIENDYFSRFSTDEVDIGRFLVLQFLVAAYVCLIKLSYDLHILRVLDIFTWKTWKWKLVL